MSFTKMNYMFLLVIAAVSFGGFYGIKTETNTSGIKISANFENMECENEVLKDKKSSLRYMICEHDKKSLDRPEERAETYQFVQKSVDTWIVSREDISLYFYKKIIDKNPKDSLSIFLQKEKF